MYAVVKMNEKQVKVQQGSKLRVDFVEAGEGSEIEVREVLLVSDNDNIHVGMPYVENAMVKLEVLGHGKDKKITVFKKIPRKGFRRLRGHRQPYTLIKVKEIQYGG